MCASLCCARQIPREDVKGCWIIRNLVIADINTDAWENAQCSRSPRQRRGNDWKPSTSSSSLNMTSCHAFKYFLHPRKIQISLLWIQISLKFDLYLYLNLPQTKETKFQSIFFIQLFHISFGDRLYDVSVFMFTVLGPLFFFVQLFCILFSVRLYDPLTSSKREYDTSYNLNGRR